MDSTSYFDYIIIGAGAAGLMLVEAIMNDAYFKDKSILILDKDAKQTNDRTWCFWEKGDGQYDHLIHRKWNHIYFAGTKLKQRYPIAPYTYKMIRGIDFYNCILEQISNHPQIKFQVAAVNAVQDEGHRVVVQTASKSYHAKKVFNSIFDYSMVKGQRKYPVLQQHFIGWFIKTNQAILKKDQATFMDFSIPQNGNTRFMYVLPFSENEALVEYTLFSESQLKNEEYENAIKHYVENNLHCRSYEILEKERGSIPMTNYDFNKHNSANLMFIGTAGGWSKASTGYTFKSTMKKIPIVIEHLKTEKALNQLNFKNKFWKYDLLLLDVLYTNNELGGYIFESLFSNRSPQLIFKFLDEETNFWEDLTYIMACPKMPFIRAFFNRLF